MASLFDGLPREEASVQNGFAGNRIDRRSEKRTDSSIDETLGEARARLYLFAGDKALIKPGDDPLFTADQAEALGARRDTTVLLGWSGDGPRLSCQLPDTATFDQGAIRLIDLRSLAVEGTMAPEHLGAMAQARALGHWHLRHRFCAACGAPTVMKMGGYRRDCLECASEHFPRTDPVVIMLAIDGRQGRDRCLMGRQARFAPGMYSCLAGFLEPGETIEDAVRRETLEESGIRVGRVRYHSSQPWPFPASLMIGCHGEAASTDIHRDETELEDCRWFTRAEVLSMLAGTHPDALRCPPPIAIAHRIIRAWVES